MRTNKFFIGGLIGEHISNIVNEVIRTISSQLIFFYEKVLNAQKRKSNQNQLTKKVEWTKATSFGVQKFLRGEKLVILPFLKNWNCLDNLIYYTTSNHEIKINRYTFPLVSDMMLKNLVFIHVELEFLFNSFYFFSV